MKILVTGVNGFLGSHILRRLRQEDRDMDIVGVSRQSYKHIWDVTLDGDHTQRYQEVYCDLECETMVAALLLRFKPDVIFHIAANPLVKEDERAPCKVSHTNVLATHHLLAYAPQGCRFVYCSSATVYGASLPTFQKWEEGDDTIPNSVYGATKLASEIFVNTLYEQGRVSSLIFRPVANVGAHATHGVVLDLVRKLKSDSPTLELLGESPGSIKPYNHAIDTAEAFVKLGLNTNFTGVFNISADDEISVEDLAKTLMDATGIRKPITWAGKSSVWRGDQPVVRVCNKWLKANGWTPKYPTSKEAVFQAGRELSVLLGGSKVA